MKERIYSPNITLLLVASLLFPACPMLVTPLIAGFSGTVGVSPKLTGLVSGAMYLCALICRPIVGNLADRVSKYRMALCGTILMAAACLGYFFAVSPVWLILMRFVHGVGFACCTVCMSTWLSYMLPKERVGSGVSLYGMMNALSMAIAPAIGVTIYQASGYRQAFLVAMMFSLLTLVAIQFVSDRGEIRPATPGISPGHAAGKLHFVEKNVLPIAIIVMLFGIPYCATQSFLVNYTEARSLQITVNLYFPFHAVVLVALRLLLKKSFDRLSFRVLMFESSACALLGILCLAFMNNDLLMFLAAAFMAGGYGIMCSASQVKAIFLAGERNRGLANSTYYLGMDLGLTLGPTVGGLLFGSMDLAWFYPILLVTVPLGLLTYFIGSRKVPL